MSEMEYVAARLPKILTARIDALVEPVAAFLERNALDRRVNRSAILRMAVAEGLRLLESRYGDATAPPSASGTLESSAEPLAAPAAARRTQKPKEAHPAPVPGPSALLREWRDARGMSRKDAAKKIKISGESWRLYEAGRVPKPKVRAAIEKLTSGVVKAAAWDAPEGTATESTKGK